MPPKAAPAAAASPAPAEGAAVASVVVTTAPVNADEDRAAAIEQEVRALLAERAAERAQTRDQCGVCTVKFVAGGTAMLLCMDTVCRACAEKAAEQSGRVQCPECYETHAGIATAADARALPYNPVLEAELVREGAVTHRCSLCEDELPLDKALAVARCEACQPAVLLCTFHVQRHRMLPSTEAHLPTRLADGALPSALTMCTKHHEPLKLYCVACDAVICYTCIHDGHPAKGHDTALLDAAFATQQRVRLTDAAVAAEAHRDELVRAMVASRLSVLACADGTKSVQAQIHRAFDLLIELVNRRRMELVEAADQLGRAEATRLAEVEESALRDWLSFDALLRLQTTVTGDGSLLVALAQVAHRLERRLQQLAALPAPAVVLSMPQLSIDDTGSFQRSLAGLGQLVVPAFGPKCTLDVRALSDARVGEAVVVTLVCRAVNGDRTSSRGARVQVALSDSNGTDVEVRPSEREDGTVALAFTPPVPGVYHLDVNVNGARIPGCPLPLQIVKVSELFDFKSFTFTHAGVTGARGPTLEQLWAAYGEAAPWARDARFLTMKTQGFQVWTVPRTGRYRLTVVGAHGAMGTHDTDGSRGGRGAKIEATVALVQGDQLRILVGQAGSYDRRNGGGGGASVVYHETSSKLLLVAGGGGGTRSEAAVDGTDACLEQHGYTSSYGNTSGAQVATYLDNTRHNFEGKGVVTHGHGGLCANGGMGGGGAGWLSNGRAEIRILEAQALNVSAIGGSPGAEACGGFGGGGMNGDYGGGGGGGYTGGNGGWIAGGGGSFVDASLADVVAAVDTERAFYTGSTPVNGYVTVRTL